MEKTVFFGRSYQLFTIGLPTIYFLFVLFMQKSDFLAG